MVGFFTLDDHLCVLFKQTRYHFGYNAVNKKIETHLNNQNALKTSQDWPHWIITNRIHDAICRYKTLNPLPVIVFRREVQMGVQE